MSYVYNESKENFSKLLEWYKNNKGNMNEAATRLKMINRILIECLGWQHDDIFPEESCEGKYADYTLNAPRKMLIVEAKKEDDYFVIPAGIKKIEYSLKTLIQGNINLKTRISVL